MGNNLKLPVCPQISPKYKVILMESQQLGFTIKNTLKMPDGIYGQPASFFDP